MTSMTVMIARASLSHSVTHTHPPSSSMSARIEVALSDCAAQLWKAIESDCVLSKTPFFLYLEKGNAQDLQTIRCVNGCSKAPTPRRAPKAHHVANKTQERQCARSCGTNVLALEQTRDKFTSLDPPSSTRE